MKTQTWLPKKRPIARTLADVPSSREKPVLCWFSDGSAVSPMWITGNCVWRADREGMIVRCNGKYTDFKLYDQPPRPTKLEDVPDRWIVRFRLDGKRIDNDTVHAFRESGKWLGLDGKVPYCMSDRWQLTDCIVEFETVEVEVIG